MPGTRFQLPSRPEAKESFGNEKRLKHELWAAMYESTGHLEERNLYAANKRHAADGVEIFTAADCLFNIGLRTTEEDDIGAMHAEKISR
jgi:hypothetical protein